MFDSDIDDDTSKNNAPMIEIFGGLFALMLVLFVVISLLFKHEEEERIESVQGDDHYKIGWSEDSAGFFVIAFPHAITLLETGETIPREQLCYEGSAFVAYANKIYQSQKEQLIFAIVEQGVATMAKARNCLMQIMPNQRLSIGWLIADDELLKSVSVNELPAHVEAYINE